MSKRITLVAGTRPNLVKIASILNAAKTRTDLTAEWIHTGQHSEATMSGIFLEELGTGPPDRHLSVGSGTHAQVTGKVLIEVEAVLEDRRPDVVVVVGDVNSSLAAALAAVKLGIPVAHVEAGLRSFDRSMPEEINRIAIDAISDLMFVTERAGLENLEREGVPAEKVHFVGNTMVDTLLAMRELSESRQVLNRLRLEPGGYAVLTLHRPNNVDEADSLRETMEKIADASERLPVVFPVHPRTREALRRNGLLDPLRKVSRLHLIPPAGYLDFLKLMASARVILTDSGGIQEETTALGVPCLTLRDNTERPVTLELGTNSLVGAHGRNLIPALEMVLAAEPNGHRVPPLWDGLAGKRIVEVLAG